MAKLVLFNIKKKVISIKSIYVNYILNSQVQIQLDLCDMFEAVLIGKTMIFIFQEKATKWYENGREIDGLTTNGILIMHPRGSRVEWVEKQNAVFGLRHPSAVVCFRSASRVLHNRKASTLFEGDDDSPAYTNIQMFQVALTTPTYQQ